MTLPDLPSKGSQDWYAWAQAVHAAAGPVDEERLPGRLSDESLKAAFVARLLPPTGTAAADTATIQAALSAAGAAGGGIVLLPGDSTWNIAATLTMPSKVQLQGQGASTLLKAVAGLNAAVITNVDHSNGNSGVVVADVAVDGNRAQQTGDFSSLDFWRLTDSRFLNLDVQGSRRQTAFPNGTDGEGLVLRASTRCQIRGGRYHDSDYDGIKLRRSDFNTVADVVCDDNGRAGIQISFWSETGPPYSVGEGDNTLGSDHNTFTGIVVRHSTGAPAAGAPTTSGIYVHTGRFNAFSDFVVEGTRQGIGLIANASDNVFSNGTLRTRWVDKAAVELEGGTNGCSRNTFSNILSRALSGADGRHIRIAAVGGLNRFLGCYFARGDGTGTWVTEIQAGANDNMLFATFADGNLSDPGNVRTLIAGPGADFLGNYGFGTMSQFGGGSGVLGVKNAATAPSTNPTGGGVLHAEGGALKWRGSSGTVTTIGPA